MLLTRRESIGAAAAALLPRGDAPRPAVAFHYAAAFTPREVAWYTRFDILVTGAILAPAQSDVLRRGGCRLVAYEWSSAYYQGDPVSAPLEWQRKVETRRGRLLLTPGPVTGASAEGGRLAEWYDYGSDELIAERAAWLAARLAEARYDGYFFDTVGWQCLPPPVQQAFQRRHPGLDYNQRQGLFLAELRKRMPAGKLIFLNQGYRHAQHLLAHADLDLSESYFTYLDQRLGTGFRPWHDAQRPWEAVKTPLEKLILPALERHPRVRMVHANYAAGSPEQIRRACRFGWACARLYGHDAYLIVPSGAQLEEDEVYFTELGKPAGPLLEDPAGWVAWREFERGVVAVNSSPRPARIAGLNLTLSQPMQGYVFAKGV